jgi:hypothetical protein
MEICYSQIIFLATIDMLDIIITLILYFSVTLLMFQTHDRRKMCSPNIYALLHGYFYHFSYFEIIYQLITQTVIH